MKVEFITDSEEHIDVWTFRALERLKVHEARTEAELTSTVVRHAEPVETREEAA